MSHGRRRVICIRCYKDKIHYGLQMCSSCLRRSKRETKPSFYLGTCYSQMLKRTKGLQPNRPQYTGLPICSREEFLSHFINDFNFLRQFEIWQESGFKRGSAPSVDRIDESLGYALENIQFLSNVENTQKSCGKNISIEREGKILQFPSQSAAARFLGCHSSEVTYARRKNKQLRGWKIICA